MKILFVRLFVLSFVTLFCIRTAIAAPIVVTVHPLAILLHDLGVPEQDIVTLIPAGVDPHAFEAVPSQIKLLSTAPLILTSSGVEFNTMLLASTSWNTKVISIGDPATMSEHGWLNPKLVIDNLPTVAQAASHARGTALDVASLEQTVKALKEVFDRPVPAECAFVSDHPMLTAWASFIGCKEVGTLRSSGSHAEMTPRSMQKIKQYKAAYPKLIFIGTSSSPGSLFTVIHESFQIPTLHVQESASGFSSFVEYYRSIRNAFPVREPGL